LDGRRTYRELFLDLEDDYNKTSNVELTMETAESDDQTAADDTEKRARLLLAKAGTPADENATLTSVFLSAVKLISGNLS